jgi:HK97 family phage major capsid protein
MDFTGFTAYVTQELERIYVDTENAQLLTGDGTGTNLHGLLLQSGILTRDYTTDHTADATVTGLDVIVNAVADLRTGAAFATADLIVLHPTTWTKLRRTKDSQGRYIVNPDPAGALASSLWGIPVVQTTSIAVGTGLVAQMSLAGDARIRQGVVIDSSPYSGTDWTNNLTRFRVEGRLGLGVPRPAAICKVTNL